MSVLSYGYPTGPFRRNNQWIAERGQDNAEELPKEWILVSIFFFEGF